VCGHNDRPGCKGAYDADFWPSNLNGLKKLSCPMKLYNINKEHFSPRINVITTNNVSIKRRVTKLCPKGSYCGSGFWVVLYNSIPNMDLTRHSKTIAFDDDLIILTR